MRMIGRGGQAVTPRMQRSASPSARALASLSARELYQHCRGQDSRARSVERLELAILLRTEAAGRICCGIGRVPAIAGVRWGEEGDERNERDAQAEQIARRPCREEERVERPEDEGCLEQRGLGVRHGGCNNSASALSRRATDSHE